MAKELATFGMGCFWQPDMAFSKLKGVLKTEVGYMGGDEEKYPDPSYEEVCSGRTGHVEVVQIIYDNKKTSYEKLLKIFWNSHDPTTLNRQGPDIGSQYRSVIFYHGKMQKELAIKTGKEKQKELGKKDIVTEVQPAGKFYKAEEYHQKYLLKNRGAVC